jgi:hypothetical protein
MSETELPTTESLIETLAGGMRYLSRTATVGSKEAADFDAMGDAILVNEGDFHLMNMSAPMAAERLRKLSATPSRESSDALSAETGWLCEMPLSTGPEWWSITDTEGEGGYFTKDSTKALRFARKEDAEAYIEDAGWTEIVATEHEWVAGSVVSQARGDK